MLVNQRSWRIEFYLKDDNGSNPDFQDLGIIRWTGHDKDNPYNKFTGSDGHRHLDDPAIVQED